MNKLKTLVAFLLIGTAVSAQTNFSGTWKLKGKEYINGPKYSNALAEELMVKQTKDSITVGKTSVAMNGKGTTIMNKEQNRQSVKSVNWSADKKTATFTTVIYAPGSSSEVELTRVDSWILSADGKEMTVNRKSIEKKSESWEVKGTYEKQ
jgi:hypothetical protein